MPGIWLSISTTANPPARQAVTASKPLTTTLRRVAEHLQHPDRGQLIRLVVFDDRHARARANPLRGGRDRRRRMCGQWRSEDHREAVVQLRLPERLGQVRSDANLR